MLVIHEVLSAEQKADDGTILYECRATLNGVEFDSIWHQISGKNPEADAVCAAWTGTPVLESIVEDEDFKRVEKLIKRKELLEESDWIGMSDCPLADEDKQAWLTYRQALRDITSVEGFPDVEFPTSPAVSS